MNTLMRFSFTPPVGPSSHMEHILIGELDRWGPNLLEAYVDLAPFPMRPAGRNEYAIGGGWHTVTTIKQTYAPATTTVLAWTFQYLSSDLTGILNRAVLDGLVGPAMYRRLRCLEGRARSQFRFRVVASKVDVYGPFRPDKLRR